MIFMINFIKKKLNRDPVSVVYTYVFGLFFNVAEKASDTTF